jgi:hypothetical protein
MVVSPKRRLMLLVLSTLAVLGFVTLAVLASSTAGVLLPILAGVVALVVTVVAVAGFLKQFLPWSSVTLLLVPLSLIAVGTLRMQLGLPDSPYWVRGTLAIMVLVVALTYWREGRLKPVAA